MRAHLNKTIRDGEGNLVVGASVRVLDAGTTTSIAGPIYTSGTGEEVFDNPFTSSDGVVSFYLADPQRVSLGITKPGGTEVIYDDLDVILPQDISTSGPTTADPHAGTGTNSTQVGADADASGPYSAAFGVEALATGDSAVGLGTFSQATGDKSVAVGDNALATGLKSTSVGMDTNATGDKSTAVGQNAYATGLNATVIGVDAYDGGEANSVIIGQNATITATSVGDSDNTVVIGTGASADNAYSSVVIGVAASAVDASVVAVGHNARGWGYASVAVGPETLANGDSGLAVGDHARADGTASIALGSGAWALADDSIAIGDQVKIQATATNSWGLGGALNITDPDVGVVRAATVEVVPPLSPSTPETAFILHDTSSNRWKVTVDTTGHLTTEAL